MGSTGTQTAAAAPCYNGRKLPQLFLLGCQKCGTTSLAQDLVTSFPRVVSGDQIDGEPLCA